MDIVSSKFLKLCKKCRNFYDISCRLDEDHTVCAAKECYMCVDNIGRCDSYKKGNVPTGKMRGAFMDYEDMEEEWRNFQS